MFEEENGEFLGLSAYADAMQSGKIWLNTVGIVENLLIDLQQVAWTARLDLAKGKIKPHKAQYLVNAKISELVKIFDGRDEAYAVTAWNSDRAQLMTYITKQEDYWGPDDEVVVEEALPRLLDCCAHAATWGVERLLGLCPLGPKPSSEQVAADLAEQRLYAGAILLGMPYELYQNIVSSLTSAEAERSNEIITDEAPNDIFAAVGLSRPVSRP